MEQSPLQKPTVRSDSQEISHLSWHLKACYTARRFSKRVLTLNRINPTHTVQNFFPMINLIFPPIYVYIFRVVYNVYLIIKLNENVCAVSGNCPTILSIRHTQITKRGNFWGSMFRRIDIAISSLHTRIYFEIMLQVLVGNIAGFWRQIHSFTYI